MPKKVGAGWRNAFPENYIAEDFVGRLGNMTLLPPGQNSRGSNHSFEHKRKNVFSDKPLDITSPILQCTEWGVEEIESRQRWLAEKACQIWQINTDI
jgi:hypothetical protein